jgi:tetratricopeptide (TPR) repeat protein
MNGIWSVWGPGLLVLAAGLIVGAVASLRTGRENKEKAASKADLALAVSDLRQRRDHLYERLRDVELDAGERIILEVAAARALMALDELGALGAEGKPDPVFKAEQPKPAAKADATEASPSEEAAPAGEGSFIQKHPLLVGVLFGGGMTAVVALLIVLAMRDATPNPNQPMAMGGDGGAGGQAVEAQEPEPLPPALQSLVQQWEQDPSNVAVGNRLSHGLLEVGRFFESFQVAQKIMEVEPSDPEARTHLAAVRMAMGMRDQARSLLDDVLENHPDLIEAYLYRGVLHAEEGDRAKAAEVWQRGVDASGGEHAGLKRLIELEREQRLPSDLRERPPPQDPASAPPHPTAAVPSADGAAQTGDPGAYQVTLSLPDGSSVPPNAVLFVSVLNEAGGPPVAVKRMASPSFPMRLSLGAADSMMGQALPENGRIRARLDTDGNVSTRIEGELQAEAPAQPGNPVELTLQP